MGCSGLPAPGRQQNYVSSDTGEPVRVRPELGGSICAGALWNRSGAVLGCQPEVRRVCRKEDSPIKPPAYSGPRLPVRRSAFRQWLRDEFPGRSASSVRVGRRRTRSFFGDQFELGRHRPVCPGSFQVPPSGGVLLELEFLEPTAYTLLGTDAYVGVTLPPDLVVYLTALLRLT